MEKGVAEEESGGDGERQQVVQDSGEGLQYPLQIKSQDFHER